MNIKALGDKILTTLKNEPVAVWGVVVAFLLGLLPLVGVSGHVVETITGVLTLIGVPVVRGKVTGAAALGQLIEGARAEGAARATAASVAVAGAVDGAPTPASSTVAPAEGDAAP